MLKITSDGLSVDDTDEAQIEPGAYFNLNDPQAAEKVRELEERNKARGGFISPPGALGLPPLLDRRRIEWRITDGAFSTALISDRIWVKQIPEWSRETAGRKSLIVLPETTREKEHRETPMGILVAAGPKALDELRSNGVDLGHRVRFIKDAVFRTRVDRINGKDEWVLVLNAGDIIGSEDLQAQFLSGKARIAQLPVPDPEEIEARHTELGEALDSGDIAAARLAHTELKGALDRDGAIQHVVVTPDGRIWNPVKPWASPDYV